MLVRADTYTSAAWILLALSWLGFGAIALIGKKRAARGARKLAAASHIGFLLQCGGYAAVFVFRRNDFSALVPHWPASDAVLFAAIVAIVAVSEWFCLAAARTLGKQWALVARVIDDHQLIQQGPYAVVRNPIYLAMFGNLLATALAFGTWPGLLAAAVLFAAGTVIRIRSEEKLLREAFGREFEEYSRRVPGFIPKIG